MKVYTVDDTHAAMITYAIDTINTIIEYLENVEMNQDQIIEHLYTLKNEEHSERETIFDRIRSEALAERVVK